MYAEARRRIVRSVSAVTLLEATVRRIDPRVVDLAAAVVLAVVSAFSEGSRSHPYAGVALSVLAAATVAVRRRAPVTATLVAGAAASGLSHFGDGTLAVLPVVFVLDYYMVGRRPDGERSIWADALVLTVPIIGVATDPNTSTPGNSMVLDVLSVWAFFFALPYAAGRAVRSRTGLNAELRMNADRLQRQQHERARQAILEERTRIARELHDVVAHSVSVMVIQTAAARAVAPRDPAAAAAALQSVESCGRDALVDMRRMIGVLHRSDVDLLGGPVTGLAQLEKLADRARAAGLPVQVSVDGEPRPLSPALDLVAFRVVQEALTNAIKHAGPARALVRVTFDTDCLRLDIIDTGRGTTGSDDGRTGGHGLVGMQERLSLYGGTLTTGHRVGQQNGGGYQVLAVIPLVGALTA
jgi:signal transduction histidine kinase